MLYHAEMRVTVVRMMAWIFIFALVVHLPLPNHELSVYRAVGYAYAEGCFGRLSDQQPCSGSSVVKRPALVAPPLRGAANSASRPLNAKVVNPQLKNLGDQRGEWSGMVSGFGHAVLYLQIVKQARLLSELKIGSVDLSGSPTPFRFRAQLPAETGWDWRVAVKPK